MKRYVALAVLGGVSLFLHTALGQNSEDQQAAKEALQALNDYIGVWEGDGSSESDKLAIWKEKADWSWRFKGKDSWIALSLEKDKLFKGGEMRFLPEQELYQLTLLDPSGKKLVFQGKVKSRKLTLERKDPDTKVVQQIQMNTASDGDRLIYTYNVKPANRTLFNKEFQVGFTRAGVTFGLAKKKVECIVTGGLGTIAVTYGGNTYYVCCSGCRDAFNETPEKFVKEYLKKKRGG